MEAISRRTGLTEVEINLTIRCFNGIAWSPPAAPERGLGGSILGKAHLLGVVRGEAANAHQDIAHSGTWLETGDGNLEAPYLITDLIERLENLSDDQAQCLLYFIEGYYHGAHIASSD